MPKKKFAFKSRRKESSNPPPKTAVAKDVAGSKVVASLSQQSKIGFKDKSHETLSMSVSIYTYAFLYYATHIQSYIL